MNDVSFKIDFPKSSIFNFYLIASGKVFNSTLLVIYFIRIYCETPYRPAIKSNIFLFHFGHPNLHARMILRPLNRNIVPHGTFPNWRHQCNTFYGFDDYKSVQTYTEFPDFSDTSIFEKKRKICNFYYQTALVNILVTTSFQGLSITESLVIFSYF
jgi:hypothetical protein